MAVFLMVIGIVFYSILTANIAAYFVESKEAKSAADLESKADQLLQQQAILLQRIDRLEKEKEEEAIRIEDGEHGG